MPPLPSRRPVLLALALLGATAPTAGAASYEQISRESGVQGRAALGFRSAPLFASDGGLLGAATRSPNDLAQFGPAQTGLRNTLTNRTTNVHPEAGQLAGVDRTERLGLFYRASEDYAQFIWSVGAISGAGSVREVARTGTSAEAVDLTGDGRAVIVTSETDTRRVTIATGASTVVASTPLGLAREYGSSDDGRVIGGYAQDLGNGDGGGVVLSGNQRIVVAGLPQIAPDGRTAHWIAGPADGGEGPGRLFTLTIATKAITSVPLPADLQNPQEIGIGWIATDGSRIVVSDLGYGADAGDSARLLTRAAGRWSTFGGPYAGSLKSGVNRSAISRNGRFAAVEYNGQVALVDLADRPLLGNLFGREPLSASSYYTVQYQLFGGCGDGAYTAGVFTKAASWVPAPRRADVRVTANGVPLKQATLTTPAEPLATSGDAVLVSFPPGTTSVSFELAVVDGAGRRVAQTYARQDFACPDLG